MDFRLFVVWLSKWALSVLKKRGDSSMRWRIILKKKKCFQPITENVYLFSNFMSADSNYTSSTKAMVEELFYEVE